MPRVRNAKIIRAGPLKFNFLISIEEADVITQQQQPDAIIDWCHRHGATNVILKLGDAGALASDGNRREPVAGHVVKFVDGTGAGDCFAGALVARMAAGDDFWQALRYTNAAAALTTTGYGAVTPLPRPEAVRRLLAYAIGT